MAAREVDVVLSLSLSVPLLVLLTITCCIMSRLRSTYRRKRLQMLQKVYETQSAESQGPVEVLALFSNPKVTMELAYMGLRPLNFGQELKHLLHSIPHRHLAVEPAATLVDAKEAFAKHRPRFLLFSGHTHMGALAFETPDGRLDQHADADFFVQMLNSCRARDVSGESATAATDEVEGESSLSARLGWRHISQIISERTQRALACRGYDVVRRPGGEGLRDPRQPRADPSTGRAAFAATLGGFDGRAAPSWCAHQAGRVAAATAAAAIAMRLGASSRSRSRLRRQPPRHAAGAAAAATASGDRRARRARPAAWVSPLTSAGSEEGGGTCGALAAAGQERLAAREHREGVAPRSAACRSVTSAEVGNAEPS